ncbi:hypothetical protein LUZ61_013141 [Rhynchospora tenuis]|uniref:Phytocyanin domain-containing protein n=1 Tax=Rhynchospora tenuis TaxID=198213 RepID=A0AAD5Z1G2_9POAL|nr:hypothetical protein LUZ61_013141 [Rhynchospora tenuis]
MKQLVHCSLSLRWLLLVISRPLLVPGKLFRVGGPMGWTVPPSPEFYQRWASPQNYTTGDVLEFSYTGPNSSFVLNVRKYEYERCNSRRPMYNFSDGMAFALLYSGNCYFISSDFNACKKGRRLDVSVFKPTMLIQPTRELIY